MESFKNNGQKVFDQFCSSSSPYSVMFPRAPEQTYVDIYPTSEQDQPGSCFRDERQRQCDYEAEVVIYRALEGILKKLIVLHSFKFTHFQRCVIENGRCRHKNQSNVEGECDFVVLGPNYIVIIEVKNMLPVEDNSSNRDSEIEALVKTFRKSVDQQRAKMKSLIERIDPNAGTTVLEYTAYPNFSKFYKKQFQENEDIRISDAELATIIFKEDISGQTDDFSESANNSNISAQLTTPNSYFSRFIKFISSFRSNAWREREEIRKQREEIRNQERRKLDLEWRDWDKKETVFSMWWDKIISTQVSSAELTPEVRDILLAMWCTEKKFNLSRCSLGNSIMEVDKQLREGHIKLETKKGKKRDINPNVFVAPDVIKNNIGIKNLSAQQKDAFECNKNMLWLNGPAGAGKSVVLCGKLLELAQADKNSKIVLFRPRTEGEGETGNKLYESALEKAKDVKYELIKYSTLTKVQKLITDSVCNVIIVEISHIVDKLTDITDILSVLDNWHIFVDDIQYVIQFSSPDDISTLIDRLSKISTVRTVRVACDIAQQYYLFAENSSEKLGVISDKLSDKQITLSRNLRNTRDISDILCLIRDMYIEIHSDKSRDIIDMILPIQSPGHFIHGPKVNFHILNSKNRISDVLDKELDKLATNNRILNNSDICVVYQRNESLVKDTVTKRCSNTTDKIAMCHSGYSYSAEWPAVIVLHTPFSNSDVSNLGILYLQLSRARVYCSVIIYPVSEEGYSEDDKRYLLPLVNKLGSIAHFVRH